MPDQEEVEIAQIEAKIAQLADEKRAAHDAVAKIEYQLDTKGRTFRLFSATEEERAWYGKTKFALRKYKQTANDLQTRISKLNAILKAELRKKKMAENVAAQEVKYLAFYRNAKAALPPEIFDAILEETIQQVGGSKSTIQPHDAQLAVEAACLKTEVASNAPPTAATTSHRRG